MARLTAKQKRFCDEYMIDLNATQAAIRAGYSPASAKEIGSENLTKPDIASRINKAMAERSRRTGVNADRVVRELAKIAFINPTDLIDAETATIKPMAAVEDTAAIQSIKVKRFDDGIEREVKAADKLKALELLGRHIGMFKDRVEISGLEEEKSKLEKILEQL